MTTDAYDIAVIITGDKDFIPALQKTRLKAKRVAICSMRNSCNPHLFRPEEHVKDFDPLWIDDYLDDIIVPKISIHDGHELELIDIIKRFLEEGSSNTSRDLGRYLSRAKIQPHKKHGGSLTALEYVRETHGYISRFFSRYDTIFKVVNDPETYPDFTFDLVDENFDEDDEDDNDMKEVKAASKLKSSHQDNAYAEVPTMEIPHFNEEALREELSSETVAVLKQKLKDLTLPMSGIEDKYFNLSECVFDL